VSVEDQTCEEFDPDGGVLRLTVTVAKDCAECGQTLKTAEVELELDVDDKKWASALKEADWQDA